MHPGETPEAIDTRLVLRLYAWPAVTIGLLLFLWGPMWLPDPDLPAIPFGKAALLRVMGAVISALGVCAAGFARVDDPIGRRQGLGSLASAHLLLGAMVATQSYVILALLPPVVGAACFIVGMVLVYLATTAFGAGAGKTRFERAAVVLGAAPERPSMDRLRSAYEQGIREAARQEERARVARDLHDAVKQQLFVIQTAAATAQTRFESDAGGARAAIDQVRSSAREAMAEMEVMLEKLQAAPLGNAGLVASLTKQCDTLGFRTGAEVKLEVGTLPPDGALAPGTLEAVFRVAQEALANVARHARARTVRVSLGLHPGELVLLVQDDGSGFDPGAGGAGMGIGNMRARAEEVGGTLDLSRRPNGGTSVRLAIAYDPYSPREYRLRALFWTVLFLAIAVQITTTGVAAVIDRPWLAGIGAIAAVAAARYLHAVYRISRARAQA